MKLPARDEDPNYGRPTHALPYPRGWTWLWVMVIVVVAVLAYNGWWMRHENSVEIVKAMWREEAELEEIAREMALDEYERELEELYAAPGVSRIDWEPGMSNIGGHSDEKMPEKQEGLLQEPRDKKTKVIREQVLHQDEDMAFLNGMGIHITTETTITTETYESPPAYSEVDGLAKPVNVQQRPPRENLVRRQVQAPLQDSVITTTCSGPITPVEYLVQTYLNPPPMYTFDPPRESGKSKSKSKKKKGSKKKHEE